jgi:ATP-dependent DNA helicase DinG
MALIDYWHFPKPPRESQIDSIKFIDESTTPIIALHAPTGTGKSAICATVANRDGGIIFTPHKLLQDQYVRDWKDAALLKGRQNYYCSTIAELATEAKSKGSEWKGGEPDCSSGADTCGHLKDAGAVSNCGLCPYVEAREKFFGNYLSISNYAWFFTFLKAGAATFEMSHHKWLLFDEGHELERNLIESATVVISKTKMNAYGGDFGKLAEEMRGKFPTDALLPAYRALSDDSQFMRRMRARKSVISGIVDPKIDQNAHLDTDDRVMIQERKSILSTIFQVEMMRQDIKDFMAENKGVGHCGWIAALSPDEEELGLKPIFARNLFKRHVMGLNKRCIITSATLSPKGLLSNWLGVGSDDMSEHTIKSDFPVENRKVKVMPVAYLNRGNLNSEFPAVVKIIDKILDHFSEDKGIIHCHSFALGKRIMELTKNKGRFLVQDSYNREEILNKHISSPEPTVLLSPSMTEGVDLAGDLSRFTIFPKTPYPYLGDPWTQVRKEVDPDWYNWQIAKTIMQGCGRSVRHSKDKAVTYILDGCFTAFYSDNKKLFPRWFRDSVEIRG